MAYTLLRLRAQISVLVAVGFLGVSSFPAGAQTKPEIFRADPPEAEKQVPITGPTAELWGTIYLLQLGEFSGGEIISVAASAHGTNTQPFAVEFVTMVALVPIWTPNNAWLPTPGLDGVQGWTIMYPSGSGVGTPTHYFDRDRASHFKVPQLPAPTQLALHYRMRCRTTAPLTGRETCLITPGMSSISALVWRTSDRSNVVSELPQFNKPEAVQPPPPRPQPRASQRRQRQSDWSEDIFGTPRRPARVPPGWPP